jgi:hypothetical protein
MKPSGAHTHPGGGPGLGLAVIVALVLVVAGSAGAAFHTAEHALDVLVHIVLIVLAIVAGLTLVGLGAAVLIRRHYEKDAASWRATVQPLATRAAQRCLSCCQRSPNRPRSLRSSTTTCTCTRPPPRCRPCHFNAQIGHKLRTRGIRMAPLRHERATTLSGPPGAARRSGRAARAKTTTAAEPQGRCILGRHAGRHRHRYRAGGGDARHSAGIAQWRQRPLLRLWLCRLQHPRQRSPRLVSGRTHNRARPRYGTGRCGPGEDGRFCGTSSRGAGRSAPGTLSLSRQALATWSSVGRQVRQRQAARRIPHRHRL